MSGDKREKSENADEKRNQFSFHFSSSCIVGCHRCGCIKLCQHRKTNVKSILFLVSSLSVKHMRTLGVTSETALRLFVAILIKRVRLVVRHIKIVHFKMDHVCVCTMKGDKFFFFEPRVFTSKTKKSEKGKNSFYSSFELEL